MNAERLLGHLIKSGLRSGGRTAGFNLGSKTMLGMGAIGVAMAAYEHFTTQSGGGPATNSSSPPTPAAAPPPIPGTATAPSSEAMDSVRSLDSPPGPPPPPPALPEVSQPTAEESMLLIRTMICAANADGLIDKDEERRILDAARSSGMDGEEMEFLESELNQPRSMFEIVADTKTDDMKKQVYTAALLALEVDNAHERAFLQDLASSLDLEGDVVNAIESGLRVN